MRKILISVVVIGAVALLAIIAVSIAGVKTPVAPKTGGAEFSYTCDAGKTVHATFYEGKALPPKTKDGPPRPGGSARVVLSDGRTFDLNQTISADGVRYSDGDPSKKGGETFVFWTKGNGALVLEHNAEKSYAGCIALVPDPGGLSEVYAAGANGFSVRYPRGWAADPSYVYENLGPKEPKIYGVKFHIPESMAAGTNLSAFDTGLSVEVMPGMPECTAYPFLISPHAVVPMNDGDVEYSVASTTDAAAGNRYEETVYALSGTNPCLAIRYFIHYGAIENYPKPGEPNGVREFDRAALLKQFDAMRRTIIVGR